MKKKVIYWILIGVFAAVFVVSGVIVIDYMAESKNHQQKMDDIRNLHTLSPEEAASIVRPTGQILRPTTTVPSTSEVPTTTVPDLPTMPSTSLGGATIPTKPTAPSGGDDPIAPTQPEIPGDATDPTEPAPSDPVDPVEPTDPAPTEPTPTEPEPTQPTPTEPAPTEPTPTVPQPDFPTKPTTMLPEMKAVYALNNDVVGWIQIKGTNIDYPVLQRKDIADYYIYKDIYGNYDKRGSIYAEEHCDVFNPSDVVVLHGHHMADGSMFHNLKNFQDKSYFDSHQYIYFDTLYERRTYQVVLLFETNGEPSNIYPFFPFHTYSDFKDEADFDDFMSSIRALTKKQNGVLIQSGVQVNYGDKLLCLSTCDYSPYPNGRMVLVAKYIG